jgi:hypothetical protein
MAQDCMQHNGRTLRVGARCMATLAWFPAKPGTIVAINPKGRSGLSITVLAEYDGQLLEGVHHPEEIELLDGAIV